MKTPKAKAASQKATPTPKKKPGRPKGKNAIYDRIGVMARVCEILSSSERGTARILKEEPGMPAIGQLWEWMDEKDDGVPTDRARRMVEMYTRAKQQQAEYMEGLLLEIADDSRNDYMEKIGKDGEAFPALNAEHIQRTRLRVDTRKWLMAKLHPRKYAESVKVGGDEELAPVRSEAKVEVDTATIDALRGRLEQFVGKKVG